VIKNGMGGILRS